MGSGNHFTLPAHAEQSRAVVSGFAVLYKIRLRMTPWSQWKEALTSEPDWDPQNRQKLVCEQSRPQGEAGRLAG